MNGAHITRIFTGSCETEEAIRDFIRLAGDVNGKVHASLFNPYMLTVMTTGRNGPRDAHPGSKAPDDTGGYFKRVGKAHVVLTDKALQSISIKVTP